MKTSENKTLGRDLSHGEKTVVTLAMVIGAIASITLFGADGKYTPLIAIAPACAVLVVFAIQHSKKRRSQI